MAFVANGGANARTDTTRVESTGEERVLCVCVFCFSDGGVGQEGQEGEGKGKEQKGREQGGQEGRKQRRKEGRDRAIGQTSSGGKVSCCCC